MQVQFCHILVLQLSIGKKVETNLNWIFEYFWIFLNFFEFFWIFLNFFEFFLTKLNFNKQWWKWAQLPWAVSWAELIWKMLGWADCQHYKQVYVCIGITQNRLWIWFRISFLFVSYLKSIDFNTNNLERNIAFEYTLQTL